MVENPTPGLSMWPGEVAVTVTREEHHQDVLARYSVAPGRERRVAVELTWCHIASGKYKGERGIEVRLDGRRVGELTHLMSQRYAPLVEHAHGNGARAGCEAVIERTERGLQVTLLVPGNVTALSTVEPPTLRTVPVAAPARAKQPLFASRKPLWIGAAVILIVLFAAIANGGDDPAPGTTAADETTTTTTVHTPPPTTTTTTTTTTPPPPPPPPPTTVAAPPVNPDPVTEEAPPAPPPPPAEPSGCDPNYTGCVPIASDVDCAGGSGNGPAYAEGPVEVVGNDIYDLDSDDDGTACE